MTEPMQKPGSSRQDFGTPRPFLDAVEWRFGKIAVDLAAHEGNHVCERYFGSGGDAPDSLTHPWPVDSGGPLWLNPEFGNIAPWVAKCAAYRGSRTILVLTPASIGTNWFADCVHRKAIVLGLSGRLSFDGKAPYPKDLMLSVYAPSGANHFDVWDWRKTGAERRP